MIVYENQAKKNDKVDTFGKYSCQHNLLHTKLTSTEGKIGMDNVSSSLNVDSEEKLNNKNKTENTLDESVNVTDDSKSRFSHLLFFFFDTKKVLFHTKI